MDLSCRAMKRSYDGIKDGPEPLNGLKEENKVLLHTYEDLRKLVQNGAAPLAHRLQVNAGVMLKCSDEIVSKVEELTATHTTDGVWDQDKVDVSKPTIENIRKEMARSNVAWSLVATLLEQRAAVHGLNDAADGKMVVIEEILAHQPAPPTAGHNDLRFMAEPCFVLVSDTTRGRKYMFKFLCTRPSANSEQTVVLWFTM
jgi:hypothetical protein